MSLPKMTTPVNNISLLDDLPNAVGGLSAAELKARFDKAGGDIQTFLNETLIPAIEQMGVDEGAARDAAIQAAIDALELDTTVENLQKAIMAAESRAKEYADTKDAANLTAAKQYADGKAVDAANAAVNAAAADATSKANAALLSAKNYANQQDAVTLLNAETAAKQYADKQDAATLTAAKEYTDGKIPSKLPNPQKLKFTGAVTGEYDGSAEKTINIPTGGGDVPAVLGNLAAQIGDAAAGTIPVYAGDEAWVVKKLMDTYTGQESDPDLSGSLPTSEWVKKLAEAIAHGYQLTEADKKAIAALVAADGTEFALSDFPTALKNPNALTFTGAATGTYDGSAALTVNIPAGGSSGSGSGGALKAMSAVGGYIGIPAADLPENGVVWMCIADGATNQEYYSGTITMQGGALSSNNMVSISSNGVIQLNQVTQVSDGIAIYGMSASTYTGVYQVVGRGLSGSLTFTGAVEATYDGTEDVVVNIPSGGASSGETLELIGTITLSEAVVDQLDFDYLKKIKIQMVASDSAATERFSVKTDVVYRKIDVNIGNSGTDCWVSLNSMNFGTVNHPNGAGTTIIIDCNTAMTCTIGPRVALVTGSPEVGVGNAAPSTVYREGQIKGIRITTVVADGVENTATGTIKIWGVKV